MKIEKWGSCNDHTVPALGNYDLITSGIFVFYFLHNMCVFSKGTCPNNPGTHFLGEKKTPAAMLLGYGPF